MIGKGECYDGLYVFKGPSLSNWVVVNPDCFSSISCNNVSSFHGTSSYNHSSNVSIIILCILPIYTLCYVNGNFSYKTLVLAAALASIPGCQIPKSLKE